MSHEKSCKIIQGNCLELLQRGFTDWHLATSGNDSTISKSETPSKPNILEPEQGQGIDLTFLDPPFNQNKQYAQYDDNRPEEEYWGMMEEICALILRHTRKGGAIYFMQREKNAHHVTQVLESSGWCFQNMIVWRKKTSAIPASMRFAKHYQIIIFATSGKRPRVFNKLRIDPPLLETEKYRRPNGMYITDVWNDIRELTSGYFAGDEPIRGENGERLHNQQSPVELLSRIILSSSHVGDTVFDPFAGTGTTLVVAKQLQRNSFGVEIDPTNVSAIKSRLARLRDADNILKYRKNYSCSEKLDVIWPVPDESNISEATKDFLGPLFND